MTRNSVALVTGSGRRLGREIALALARSGFNIVVNYNKSKAEAEQTTSEIRNLGADAIAVQADVSESGQVVQMVRRAVAEFAGIDVLVNNAGVFPTVKFSDISEDVWDTTLDVNLKGVFLCSQAVSAEMMKRGSGRIINIASLGGVKPWKTHVPYSVSKAGVIMLTKCLAKALAPNITVNAVAPGVISLPGEGIDETQRILIERIPLKRLGDVSEITGVVSFLAESAGYVTGQVFIVDGGLSIA
jgi:3-oxoacyl-[acyl-carrier protein] reductase